MPLVKTMTTEDKFLLRVQPMYTDDAGVTHPASLDGPATFTVQSGDCTLEAETGFDDRMWVVSGTAGASMILVAGDADLGDGVVAIQDTVDVTVTDPLADSLGLTADDPVKK